MNTINISPNNEPNSDLLTKPPLLLTYWFRPIVSMSILFLAVFSLPYLSIFNQYVINQFFGIASIMDRSIFEISLIFLLSIVLIAGSFWLIVWIPQQLMDYKYKKLSADHKIDSLLEKIGNKDQKEKQELIDFIRSCIDKNGFFNVKNYWEAKNIISSLKLRIEKNKKTVDLSKKSKYPSIYN